MWTRSLSMPIVASSSLSNFLECAISVIHRAETDEQTRQGGQGVLKHRWPSDIHAAKRWPEMELASERGGF